MSAYPKSYHVFESIGVIRTPYKDTAPFQPVHQEKGEFKLVLEPQYTEGLKLLDTFSYIYVIYALDKIRIKSVQMQLSPPWSPQIKVGVFASRTPARPNPIGISIVKIKEIHNNIVYISGIDAFDGTPLLDVKPYLNILDVKKDANYGWVNQTGDELHLALHIKGIPHKH